MSGTTVAFFILGAPKSGTTALAETLDTHPDLTMSKPKEPHFFDAYYEEDLTEYATQCFPQTSAITFHGEATPSYFMVPWVAPRIAKHFPKAKLIVCLRNPVDRAFSSWWMQYSRGLETLDFQDAITASLNQADVFAKEDATELWTSQIDAIAKGSELPIRTYIEAGLYHKHLTRFLEHFPREQIHVVFSSDFRQSRASSLADVWDFLSVPPWTPDQSNKEVVNAAYGKRAMFLLRLAKRMGLMRIREHVPQFLREPTKAYLSRLGDTPKIDQEMRAYLTSYFRDSNLALEELLSVDLSGWR